jgi:hypothetical protein
LQVPREKVRERKSASTNDLSQLREIRTESNGGCGSDQPDLCIIQVAVFAAEDIHPSDEQVGSVQRCIASIYGEQSMYSSTQLPSQNSNAIAIMLNWLIDRRDASTSQKGTL